MKIPEWVFFRKDHEQVSGMGFEIIGDALSDVVRADIMNGGLVCLHTIFPGLGREDQVNLSFLSGGIDVEHVEIRVKDLFEAFQEILFYGQAHRHVFEIAGNKDMIEMAKKSSRRDDKDRKG